MKSVKMEIWDVFFDIYDKHKGDYNEIIHDPQFIDYMDVFCKSLKLPYTIIEVLSSLNCISENLNIHDQILTSSLKDYPDKYKDIEALKDMEKEIYVIRNAFLYYVDNNFAPFLKQKIENNQSIKKESLDIINKYYKKDNRSVIINSLIVDPQFKKDYALFTTHLLPATDEIAIAASDAYDSLLAAEENIMVYNNILDLYDAYCYAYDNGGKLTPEHLDKMMFIRTENIQKLLKKSETNAMQKEKIYASRFNQVTRSKDQQGLLFDSSLMSLVDSAIEYDDAEDLNAFLFYLYIRDKSLHSIPDQFLLRHKKELTNMKLQSIDTGEILVGKDEIKHILRKSTNCQFDENLERKLKTHGQLWNIYKFDDIFTFKGQNNE